MTDARLDVAAFDRVSPAAASELLRPVCASGAWRDAMVARRPHGDLPQVQLVSDTVIAGLSGHQLHQALDAEPELERAPGDDRAVAELADRRALTALVRERLARTLV